MKKKIALMVVAVMAAASVQVFAAESTESLKGEAPQYTATSCGGYGGGYGCYGGGCGYGYRGGSNS